MKLNVEPGKYIVAVSGGVDSVVLLDLLTGLNGLELVVAHFDHGIRVDSGLDRQHVATLAKQQGLQFEYAEGQLGATASEARARQARYEFLRNIQIKHQAAAIITAHHQDDMIETAIINLLRGTGRKGLSSLGETTEVLRPLLSFSKQRILRYANQKDLSWREDSTNRDTKYLRNYIRLNVVPRLTKQQRQAFLEIIARQRRVNIQIDAMLQNLLKPPLDKLQRQQFIMLPYAVATETMAAWLRQAGISDFDRATIDRAVNGAKTAQPGKKISLKNDWYIAITKGYLALTQLER